MGTTCEVKNQISHNKQFQSKTVHLVAAHSTAWKNLSTAWKNFSMVWKNFVTLHTL